MEYVTAIITLVIVIITLSYNIRRKNRINNSRGEKSPPEADGAWPIIGHLHLLSGSGGELPHVVLSNLADKYGPIFGIRLGVHRALIVSSREIATECFTGANDVVFSNRISTAAFQHMSYNFAILSFNPYGAYWRELRKISNLKLLSKDKVASLGGLREAEVGGAMRSLYGSCGGAAAPLEMRKVFGDLTLSLIVRIVAGDNEKRRMDESEGGGDRWHRPIKEFFEMVGVVTVADVIPFFRWVGINYYYSAAFKKTAAAMDGLLQSWLEEHKKKKKKQDHQVNGGFMAEMMAASDKLAREFPQYDADTITKATCQTMIFAGTDTMSVTLTWALSLLLNNRHVITRAHQELDTYVGRERQVKASDTGNLVYIKAIIKETLRLRPPTCQLPPRLSSEDCTVAGYHVPAGTWLIVNLWKLHRDPRVWPDPSEFKPERFLTSHKEFDVRGQNFELLPFGSGRRMCPGISFALQTTEYALASLLHGFNIETVPLGGAVDMTASFGATNMKATPLEVVLTPRLAHHHCA